ncbi:TonB-dependent receptor [Carboxylicivirga sp. A043]|uniref:TonB-dependent receptor n=1 Tax=Carboxylicivirga litoralis TaxID=2816963 RepID=UPI0021CAEADF|nr:TonB-dependent receptor [Carboxylicivirga sp. A043]MCU4158335.1 TonB-dependent receptor [Carboxylicivirga sp. A043]
MSRFIMLLISMSFIHVALYSQAGYQLSGSVLSEDKSPLTGAVIYLHPIKKGTISDASGNFTIDNLSIGRYTIEVSFIGYKTLSDTITINGNQTYKALLKVSSMSLQEVVVKDNYAETRKKEESLNIEIVNDEYLKKNLGGSLMNSLERLPGVSTIGIGSGQSKPVIRGLSFNRVVVVENNIKHEAQQWGKDHGLEIDQYAVDNVEVIKGPASLIYGSDAIGGVINMNMRHLPAENTFGGSIDLTGKSNNDLLGTSISLYGRKKWFYATARATLIDYGDYKVPTDYVDIYSYKAALHYRQLRNTAGKEHNLHASFGIIQNGFQSKFHVSSVNSKSGFFANAHGLEPRNVDTELHDKSNRDINHPYQSVHHFKLSNTTQYQWESTNVEFNLGFQRNFRQEFSQYTSHGYMPPVFPDTINFASDLERQFEKYVYSGNVKLGHHLNEQTQLFIGLNSEYQDNAIDGRGFIIPAYEQINVGAYTVVKHTLNEKANVQLGVRYDYGHINTKEYNDWFPSPIDDSGNTAYLQRAEAIERSFSNISWSAGFNYHPGKWSYKANVGKSFRIPIAKELAANGVNYHHFSYEVGNPDLSAETSYQLDMGVEYSSKDFAIGATPFLNYFPNYIYLNPTAEHDRLYGNGNQVFYYTESEVFRYGTELHAHYELLKHLQLGLMGEYVYSEQLSGEKKGFTLPFSPPASAIINLKYHQLQWQFIKNAYYSLDYRLTASQNEIVPPEEPTDGYQVVNLGFGGDVQLGNQTINVSMQVQNLFNTKYFNHTSFYRLINVPEAGRNIVVNILIPFSGNIN